MISRSLFCCAALLAILLLPGCAYILDSQQQKMTFNTLNANNTSCNVWVDGLHYVVYPPETITVTRSKHDLTVDCLAPGLREKKFIIPAQINDTTTLNASNAAIGVVYDYLSEALWAYPSRIEVDFGDLSARMEPMPAQNAPDTIQPEDHYLEEYSPRMPLLNSDRYRPAMTPLQRRMGDEEESMDGDGAMDEGEPVIFEDKGDLKSSGSSGKGTVKSSNHAAPSSNYGPVVPNPMANPGAAPQPVPSYPGE